MSDDNIINFPGEYLSKDHREMDRWSALAFCAVVIAGRPRDKQRLFLSTLLKAKFQDISSVEQPPLEAVEHVPAYAAFAVKTLLEVLTEDSDNMREAGERTRQYFRESVGFPGEPPTPPSA